MQYAKITHILGNQGHCDFAWMALVDKSNPNIAAFKNHAGSIAEQVNQLGLEGYETTMEWSVYTSHSFTALRRKFYELGIRIAIPELDRVTMSLPPLVHQLSPGQARLSSASADLFGEALRVHPRTRTDVPS